MQRWTHRLDDEDDVSLRNIDAQNLQRRVAECVRVCARVFLIYSDAQTGSTVSALRLCLMPPGLPSQSGASHSAANTHIPAWRVYPLFIYLFSPHHPPHYLSPCGGECPLPADVAHWRVGYVTADEAVI